MAPSLKQQAYTLIKSKILSCEYAPNMFINEEFLCKEINASRTPVRDALSRLEQENLLTIIPKKGVMVAPVTINEINTIYETRILLEPYILANYGTRITPELLDRMQKLIDGLHVDKESCAPEDVSRFYGLDDEYHRILVNLCENKYLIQCYQNIYDHNLRLRILSGNQLPERLMETQKEHIRLHNEILKRNYTQAAEVLRQHLVAAKDAAFQVLMKSNYSI
ncbi:GntR family transcriptional regulator [Anaerotalea alkaliphila]|uniref:GntR family transcriptional regulator n=1 Tax=Anaerotalea alkaliphila TaxID=2662126 RepID=A0A7X5HUF4_9FIRM|nr:GntR family transcriptional regulator [Anaerotalea alkaliphila]NDL66849.1 GntR family transcriptional regulator [Anaerotalea alkaliphila]